MEGKPGKPDFEYLISQSHSFTVLGSAPVLPVGPEALMFKWTQFEVSQLLCDAVTSEPNSSTERAQRQNHSFTALCQNQINLHLHHLSDVLLDFYVLDRFYRHLSSNSVSDWSS